MVLIQRIQQPVSEMMKEEQIWGEASTLLITPLPLPNFEFKNAIFLT